MAETDDKLRLAAVLAADVAGFTRLMADDERATMAALEAARAVFREHVAVNSGRVVDTAGDSVLAVFENAAGAVLAALAVQKKLDQINEDVSETRRMLFRVGVHLGDINEKPDGTIYGDGVNVAARLESLAKPGRIAVSDTVFGTLRGRMDVGFIHIGDHKVKNVAEPVRAYQVTTEDDVPVEVKRAISPKSLGAVAAASVAAMGAAIVIWWSDLGVDEPAPPQTSLIDGEQHADLSAVPPLPEGPKIAVLPFENLSDDPSREIFSNGLTEDISLALSKFQNFFVIAPQSTARYKGRSVDLSVIGDELGIDYVLLGSVRHEHERIRITVKVLNVQDQTQVWGDTYDRDLSTHDIFAIQDDIADNIASRLGGETGQISRAHRATLGVSAQDDLEAYACVLRAHGFYDKITEEEHGIVRGCLENAVAKNPDFAEAWAWLAYMYRDEVAHGFNTRGDGEPPLDRALAAARKAVTLAPSDQLGYDVLASVYFARREMDLFKVEALKAIELNPNSSRTVAWMGSMIALAGDWEYGIQWLRRTMALNPYHPGWYQIVLGYYYYFHKRDFRQALEEFQKVNMPGFLLWHMSLAMTYGQLGRPQDARAELDRLIEIVPDIAETYRDHQRQWIWSEDEIELGVEGLRKAGLDIPDTSGASD